MEVRHAFAAVPPIVDDEPVASFFEPQHGRDFRRFEQQVPKQNLIVRTRFADARNEFLWNDQNVDGRLGPNVVEGNHEIILMDNPRRNFARDDLLEEGHGPFFIRCRYCTTRAQFR